MSQEITDDPTPGQVMMFDSTQPLVSDIKQSLPKVSSILKREIGDLAVIDFNYWPKEYMWTDHRDKAVEAHGALDMMPDIKRGRLHEKSRAGIGIYVYESRLDPGIRYALLFMRTPYADESYIVVPKDKLFRLKRNAIRLNKLSSEITEKPVLKDGLLDEIVQNTVGFLLRAKDIEKYGVKIKRGVILDGDPGNGKTMLCRYIQKLCAQNNIKYGTVTSAEIDGAYEDKMLTDLFTQYTVTFFDDIDVGYMDRKRGNGKMACSLLTAMDGMHHEGHLVRIFTTNEPVGDLDPAFTRPGRIDKCVTLERPDDSLRRKLVDTVWPAEIRNGIDVDSLIEQSQGFSFAELEAIRTFLVTNKILGDGTWDLAKAFGEFNSRRADKKRKGVKKVGFGYTT